jgi:hypothetical protein
MVDTSIRDGLTAKIYVAARSLVVEGRGKGEEGRGEREEERGKREEGRGERRGRKTKSEEPKRAPPILTT